jgi:hypothetical protein
VLLALDEYLSPPQIDVYRGTEDQLGMLERRNAPRFDGLTVHVPVELTDLPGQLARQPAIDGKLTRYRCVGTHCEAPEAID